MKGKRVHTLQLRNRAGCHSLATWESHHGGQTRPALRVSHPALSTYSLRLRQCQLYFSRSSSHCTSLAFPMAYWSPLSGCRISSSQPIPVLLCCCSHGHPYQKSHLLKLSLPLLFLSPIPTDGQIPRIATTLQIHSFFAILTSILTSSTLRAYHLYSLDVPNGFLTGSAEL